MALGSPNLSPEISPTSSRRLLGSRDDSESSRSDEVSIDLGNGTAVTPISTFNESQPPHNPSPALPSPGAVIQGGGQVHLPSIELHAPHIIVNITNNYTTSPTNGNGSIYFRFFMKMEMSKQVANAYVPVICASLVKTLPLWVYAIAFFGLGLMCLSMMVHHQHAKLAYAMQVVGSSIFIYFLIAILESHISGVDSPFSRFSSYVGYCLCVIDIAIIVWMSMTVQEPNGGQ